MAYQPTDPYRAPLSEEEIARQARLNSLDNEIQPDPMLDEGGPSGTKVAMFAVAIAVVLGALFYGLNNTSVNQAGTEPSAGMCSSFTVTAQTTSSTLAKRQGSRCRPRNARPPPIADSKACRPSNRSG